MRVHFASHSQMSSFRDWNSTIKLLLTAGGGVEHLFYADFSRGGYWTEWGTHLQEKEKQMAGTDSEIKWKQQATTRAAALSLLSIPTHKIIVHIAQQLVVEKALNCMHGLYLSVKDYLCMIICNHKTSIHRRLSYTELQLCHIDSYQSHLDRENSFCQPKGCLLWEKSLRARNKCCNTNYTSSPSLFES